MIGTPGKKIKVMSWNVRQGMDVHKTVEVIKCEWPDILLLQELDKDNARTDYNNIIEILSEAIGYNYCYQTEFKEVISPYRDYLKFIGQGGGEIGNAILSFFPIKKCEKMELSTKFFDWESKNGTFLQRLIKKVEPRIGKRNAVITTIDLYGHDVVLVTTHIEDKAGGLKGRRYQLNEILEFPTIKAADRVIFGGDFNSKYWKYTAPSFKNIFTGHLTDKESTHLRTYMTKGGYVTPFDEGGNYTFKFLFIKHYLDWIFTRGFRSVEGRLGTFEPSDHRYMIAEAML